MARTHQDMMAALPEERRLRVEARAAEMLAEVDNLQALRKLAKKTQKAVADKLNVSQPAVHQIEHQADVYWSTMTGYIEALGGTVELRVTLPEIGVMKLNGPGDIAPSLNRQKAVKARQVA